MSLRRAKSPEEYADWVKQAMFEVGDLKECILYEAADELRRFPAYLEVLEESVKEIYDQMCNGTYQFGREDLAFMEILHDGTADIPFATLLKQINDTHRHGLEIDEED